MEAETSHLLIGKAEYGSENMPLTHRRSRVWKQNHATYSQVKQGIEAETSHLLIDEAEYRSRDMPLTHRRSRVWKQKHPTYSQVKQSMEVETSTYSQVKQSMEVETSHLLIGEAEYGSRNIPLTTNLLSLLNSKIFELSIRAGKIIKE